MKRTIAILMAFWVAILILPAIALAVIPAPALSGIEVHWGSQASELSTPLMDPDHPEYYAPDVTFNIELPAATSATQNTRLVSVFQDPFLHSNLGISYNLPFMKTFEIPISQTSLVVTMTPIMGWSDYKWNIQTWLVNGSEYTTGPAEYGALVTSTPSPVFNTRYLGPSFAWDNFRPTYWDGTEWVNNGTSGNGGPVGTLSISLSRDGVLTTNTTLPGTARSWALPTLVAGHTYVASVSRSFEGKTSPKVNASKAIWASTRTSITGPRTGRRNRTFTVSGAVTPIFPGVVKVKVYKKRSSRYVYVSTKTATFTSGKWHIHYKAGSRTNYRFQATFTSIAGRPVSHSHSGYKYVSVK